VIVRPAEAGHYETVIVGPAETGHYEMVIVVSG
jgi:hypothetical protein